MLPCMDLREVFATNLRRIRNAKGLSQDDLAFFHHAWQEIEKMEAVWNYGIGNFKFEF